MNRPLTFQTVTFSVIDHHGQQWLRGPQIAAALGYRRADILNKLYSAHAAEFTSDMTTVLVLPELVTHHVHRNGVAGRARRVRVFSLRGAHLLGMLAATVKAEAFRRWVLDVLEGVTSPSAAAGHIIPVHHQPARGITPDLISEAAEVATAAGVLADRMGLVNCDRFTVMRQAVLAVVPALAALLPEQPTMTQEGGAR